VLRLNLLSELSVRPGLPQLRKGIGDEFIIHSEMLQDQRISRINNLLAYSFLLGISRVVNVVLSERETHLASGRVAF